MFDPKHTKFEPLPTTNTAASDEVKLADGGTATLAFTGQREVVDTVYADQRTQFASPELLRQGHQIKKRVFLPALDLRDGRHVFVDLAGFIYNQILDQQGAYPPARWAWDFSRHGTGKETKYYVQPIRPLTPLDIARRDALPPLDLPRLIQQKYGGALAAPSQPVAPTTPTAVRSDRIAPDDVADIEETLAGLPPEVKANFLETFSVTAVADLNAAQTGPAVRYAHALAAENPRPAPPRSNNINF